MKLKFFFSTIFLVLLISFECRTEVLNNHRCKIEGRVIDRPYSKELLLIKEGGDERFPLQVIPIKNAAFSLEIEFDNVESYELVFRDEFDQHFAKPIVFFVESGKVLLELHPLKNYRFNKVGGTRLNDQFHQNNQIINAKFPFWQLEDSLSVNEIERDNLQGQLDSLLRIEKADSITFPTPNDERLKDSLSARLWRTEFYLDSLESEYDKMYASYLQYIVDGIKNDRTIIGLRDMFKLLLVASGKSKTYLPISTFELKTIFINQYKQKFPTSYYTREIESFLLASEHIRIGAKYTNVEAEDLAGKKYLLSELIDGKLTIVHFWASWCLSCRSKGKELMELYKDFEDERLNIVGIARERSINDAVHAIKADGYPWLNLVDLKDKYGIWDKYGMKNSGGDVFLIDKGGKIIAYAASIDELRRLLSRHL